MTDFFGLTLRRSVPLDVNKLLTSKSRRIFYFVNHSFPASSNGYAVRSHQIALALIEAGFDVLVITSSDFFAKRNNSSIELSQNLVIEGVRYYHINSRKFLGLSFSSRIKVLVNEFIELIQVFKPYVIMAASDWRNALPAAIASAESRIPFLYEVRGFWHFSRAAHNHLSNNRDYLDKEGIYDIYLANYAHKVFTINQYMKNELVSKGVSPDHVDLVPNGVAYPVNNIDFDYSFIDSMRSKAKYWIGYIGSFGPYEGLDDLVNAVASLRSEGLDVGLLLVGSSQNSGLDISSTELCSVSNQLIEYSKTLNMSDFLILTGRLKKDEAVKYYSYIDMVVIPRKPMLVSELVSPLKPIEAASFGKVVLMSDVAPLYELRDIYPNFFYFSKGNFDSLVSRLRELLVKLPSELPNHAYLANRAWANCIQPIVKLINSFSL